MQIRCPSVAKNDSQLHQKLLFAFEKSLWNVTWTFELYKKHSQWGCCKAAAKHSLCNQDLGDGSPRWWQALWKLLVGNKVLTCSELFTLHSQKQQPPPHSSQSDLLCWKKQNNVLQVALYMVSISKLVLRPFFCIACHSPFISMSRRAKIQFWKSAIYDVIRGTDSTVQTLSGWWLFTE